MSDPTPTPTGTELRCQSLPIFGDAPMSVVLIGDRPFWTPRQIAKALDYANESRIANMITQEWSDDFVEGTDYITVRGHELGLAKAAGLAAPQASALTLLTESGVNLVAILSRQPKSRDLRRWLADDVLPALRKTGTYAARPVAGVPLSERFMALAEEFAAKGDTRSASSTAKAAAKERAKENRRADRAKKLELEWRRLEVACDAPLQMAKPLRALPSLWRDGESS